MIALEIDPLTAPHATIDICDAAPRQPVVVHGMVERVVPTRWTGGPVLEVTLGDDTGRIVLAFFGRKTIGGIQPGRYLATAGVVGTHRGRQVILNPFVWLDPPRVVVPDYPHELLAAG